MSRRGRRRWVRRALVALGLSAAVQSIIVLAPAGWDVRPRKGRLNLRAMSTQAVLTPDDRVWQVDHFHEGVFGTVLYAHTRADAHRPDVDRARRQALTIDVSDVPAWASFPVTHRAGALPTDPQWESCSIEERAEGWPWRCVRGEKHIIRTWVSQPSGSVQATVSRVGYISLPRDIWVPYLPIWRGIVLDPVVLALPWYLLLCAVGATRRWRRHRRGRCGECNYDLTGLGVGSVCPECGLQPNRIAPPKRG